MNIPRPSPALIVAMLALTVSLSTVSYAAITIPKNSVGAAQLKKNAVVTKKIKPGAVTNPKLRAGTITGDKVAKNTLTGAHIDESTLVLPGGAVSLVGYDFESLSDHTTFGNAGGGRIYRTSGSDPVATRLDLPQGATITSVKVYVGDTASPDNITAQLVRFNPGVPPSWDLLANANTAGTPGDTTLDITPTLGPNDVDNTRFSYQIQVHLATTHLTTLIGARVTYSQAPATAR